MTKLPTIDQDPHDSTFTVSENGIRRPGRFGSRHTAESASQLTDAQLQELQDEADRDNNGVIDTTMMIGKLASTRPE